MTQSDQRPHGAVWNYDRAEVIADSVVHATGLALGLIGAIAIMILLATRSAAMYLIASVSIYLFGLLAMLGLSAAYNLWPINRVKWLLRRFDHSAIYLLIAGTYTPFMAQLTASLASIGLFIGVWVTAIAGIVMKLVLPGRFDRLSVAFYLILGWSGILAYRPVAASLPSLSLWMIAAGGALYSIGVIFYSWRSLRFHNAIWHCFVLLAAACHYAAVLHMLPPASALGHRDQARSLAETHAGPHRRLWT